MHPTKTLMTGIAAATLVALNTPNATAEVVVAPAPPPHVTTERESVRPNLPLMGTGLITLTVGYAPALVVAIESDHKGDDKLFIPVVGPWLDMGKRGCDPLEVNCGSSGIETAALITDGVVQGLGALQIVAGLVTPQYRTVVHSASNGKPRVRIAPSSLGGRGYGLFAAGTF
jgi:hypothetical protein